MKFRILIIAVLICSAQPQLSAQSVGRENFDRDWKFHLGDVADAEQAAFPDQSWRSLDVPHDWSIEGTFKPDHPSGHQGGLLPGGVGWYRKSFRLSSVENKKFYIVFDGVYKNSTVYINGQPLGSRPYGYATFQYDLTGHVHAGENVLAVKVDNSKQPDSRWYTGAGIYRHVWFITTAPLHIRPWGTFVTTPKVSRREAQVRVTTQVANDSQEDVDLLLVSFITDADGKRVASQRQTIRSAAASVQAVDTRIRVKAPKLWDVHNPNLYRLTSQVYKGSELTDVYVTPFGIRSIAWKSDSGFYLNGENVIILGVCNHHDLGCLGAAVNHRALQRQLQLLKSMGCNAIRCSHNLMAPELLDLCDEMGFLVMDETFDSWYIGKDAAPHGFQNYFHEWHERETVDMVLRDRNHPSVILWSIGNEIKEQWFPGSTNGGEIARKLVRLVKQYDATRFTTSAFNFIREADEKGMTAAVDVVGFNYSINLYDEIRGKHPDWFYIASETTSQFDSRGVYHFTLDTLVKTFPDCQASAFDDAGGGTTHEKAWRAVKERPWLAGLFVWTGFDYIGEPSPYQNFSVSSYFGILDLCGFPKDAYYFYQSQWTDEPMVHLLPHWNWRPGQSVDVVAYTNCEEVRLFLNEQPLEVKKIMAEKKLSLRWTLPFTSGVLRAEGFRHGRLAAVDTVRTAGDAAKVVLSADRSRLNADGKDLSFIKVKITDANGTLCPTADNLVLFEITGQGKIAGVGNGDPVSRESFKGRQRHAFSGLCQVVLQSTDEKGRIELKASSLGLKDAKIIVTTD